MIILHTLGNADGYNTHKKQKLKIISKEDLKSAMFCYFCLFGKSHQTCNFSLNSDN